MMKFGKAGKMTFLALLAGLFVVLGLLYTPEAGALRSAPRAAAALEYLALKPYPEFQTKEHLREFNAELNALGREGWELVVSHPVLIFKRLK